MTRTFPALCLIIALIGSVFADDQLPVLTSTFETYCFKCHGAGDDVEADINLKKLAEGDRLFQSADVLQELISVIRDGEMPPAEEAQLPDELRERLLVDLQQAFDTSLQSLPFEPTPIAPGGVKDVVSIAQLSIEEPPAPMNSA